MQEKKLYDKLSKFEFWLKQISFLGHVISTGGIVVDPSKVDAVLQWETSKSITEIQSFLGLANYYHKFIEGFSKLALLLTHLTRKGRAFFWDVSCKESFQELKKKMMSAPVRILPSLTESFIMYYDVL